MFTPFVLALALTANISATGADWSPFFPFMGSWSGTRTTSAGKVSVNRDYEPVDNNQRLLVSDRVRSSKSPWGLVSFDPARGVFVLRRFGPDGRTVDLELSDVSKDGTTLVFDGASSDGSARGERITTERHGWAEFVERVESRTNGTTLTLVSETEFHRKR